MKNTKTRVISIILSVVMVVTLFMPHIAFANNDSGENKQVIRLNDSQREFLEKYKKLLDKFSLDKDGYLKLNVNKEELIKVYGFNQNEAEGIINSVKLAYPITNADGQIKSRIHISSGKIYFTHSDVTGLLISAAQIGPVAVYGVLVGLGSTLGPVGTTLVAALGIIGAPSLASFTYNVIQAQFNKQGVYIGVEFNGIFPNIVQGVWSGE